MMQLQIISDTRVPKFRHRLSYAETIISLPQELLLHAGIASSADDGDDYAGAFVALRAEMVLGGKRHHQQPVFNSTAAAAAGGSTTNSYATASSSSSSSAPSLDPRDLDRDLLCLKLLLERAKGEASLWHPYIAFLPGEYDDPYWWSPEAVDLVAGTRLGRAIQQHRPGLDRISELAVRLEELR